MLADCLAITRSENNDAQVGDFLTRSLSMVRPLRSVFVWEYDMDCPKFFDYVIFEGDTCWANKKQLSNSTSVYYPRPSLEQVADR